MNTYLRLLAYVKPYWWAFILVALGFSINAGGEVAGAKLLQIITDAINQKNHDVLKWLPLLIIVLFFFRGLGSFLGGYYSAFISRHLVYKLRTQAFEHILKLPNRYFLTHSGGTLASKLIYDVEQVTAASTDALTTILRDGLIVIGLLGFMLYLNWRLSIILFVLLPIMGVLIGYASKRFRRFSHKVQDAMGQVSHIVSEVIGGVSVVKQYGAQSVETARFDVASQENLKQSMKMAITSNLNTPAVQMIIAIAMSIVLFLALKPEVLGNSSAGEFIAYITACIALSKPIRELTKVNEKIQSGLAAATSVFAVLDEPAENDTGTKQPKLTGGITFKQVNLTYDEGTQALTDINLDIKAGETVAFVGRSGAGKSSLINLLTRTHELSSGDILFDGITIKDISLASLRQQISGVNQQVVLFDTDIFTNIAYGELQNSSEPAVIKAAQDAHAHEFITKLKEGYQTRIGTEGLTLSGGQRQRLAIARALLKDSPILILDEATSALDNESEHFIQQALTQAMQGRTTLVIAHRLSTIEKADRIVVMDAGKIIEQGTHTDLLALNGVYASMHARNFTDL